MDGLPFVAGLLLLLAGLRARQAGRDATLGRVGFIVTAIGGLAVAICIIASILTRSENSLGPVYMLGTFVTVIGVILFAIAMFRARVLPRWVGPALALTWIVGRLLGDNGPLGFKASGLLLAVTAVAIAAVCAKAE